MKTDSKLKDDVLEELQWDVSVNEPGISVSVKDGIVTLTGTVDTYAEKRAAERAAKRVNGVKGIIQKIEVCLLGLHKRSDQEISDAAANALRWNTMIPKDSVKVKTEGSWITLEGKVDWNYQRVAAYDAVKNLSGIRGVTNLIEVGSKIQPHSVKENIKRVFERNALLDAEKIHVNVDGHKVILSGSVQTWDEQKQALAAAWSAPGVWQVENQLEIKPREYPEIIQQ